MAEMTVSKQEMRDIWGKALKVGGAISKLVSGGRNESLYVLKFEDAHSCEDFATALAELQKALVKNARIIVERTTEAPQED